ncbi:hypothetical protein EK21DRAFT_79427 [Setomelanomma holmii]|uniref:Uncharacterized protein n=1 Tax=Setomelanomma holmii TaxID=210430 RepID=A0A9P4GYM9_9PLEO|nr:hypothetical protein EK21DRAFT_79427 [Setomelanomma holmii]
MDERSARAFRGLSESRHQFLSLCVLARCTLSNDLARALGNFIDNNARHITDHENPGCLHEWVLAVYELRGLLPDYTVDELLSSLTTRRRDRFGGWDVGPHQNYHSDFVPWPRQWTRCHIRSRTPHLREYGWDQRLISSPPVRRCRSLDQMLIGFPTFPPSRWPTPVMSPLLLPTSDYSDDVGEVKWEQAAQAAEVEDLKYRVKQLEWEG